MREETQLSLIPFKGEFCMFSFLYNFQQKSFFPYLLRMLCLCPYILLPANMKKISYAVVLYRYCTVPVLYCISVYSLRAGAIQTWDSNCPVRLKNSLQAGKLQWRSSFCFQRWEYEMGFTYWFHSYSKIFLSENVLVKFFWKFLSFYFAVMK